ncbi:hypothetical protein E4U59_000765 [Claviceps monticola]|nr:hypothetical protein E4U59_000765 [Claviceps monticola]
MMSHKNWNDRADKDLFFTILSLKDVGLISGEEWCRIGNHMRCLGYRFTNEGCRQHFQGLRRAQNKAAAVGTAVVTNPYHADPTLNPTTRRPGAGKGRPKKHSLASAPEVGQPVVKHAYPTILPRPESVHPPAPAPEQHIRQAGEAVAEHGAPSQPHGAPIHVRAFSSAYTADARHVSFRDEGGGSGDGVRTGNDGGNRDEREGAVGRFGEERAVKRRRFEEPPDLKPSVPPSAPPLASASAPSSAPPLAPPEEEAVLAMAAHTGTSGPNLQGNRHIQKLRRGQASTHKEQVTVANGGISEPATPRKRKTPVKKAASAKSVKYAARDRQSDDEGDYILSAGGAEPVTPSSGCTNKAKT